MTLDQDIQLAFTGTQIIIVFVTVLFDLFYRQIQKDMAKKITYDENKFKKLKGSLLRNLLYCLVLIFVNGFVFFMFIPLLCQIFNESGFYFWTYNFTKECFFFITIIILGFFIASLLLTGKLISHIFSVQKKFEEQKKFVQKK